MEGSRGQMEEKELGRGVGGTKYLKGKQKRERNKDKNKKENAGKRAE